MFSSNTRMRTCTHTSKEGKINRENSKWANFQRRQVFLIFFSWYTTTLDTVNREVISLEMFLHFLFAYSERTNLKPTGRPNCISVLINFSMVLNIWRNYVHTAKAYTLSQHNFVWLSSVWITKLLTNIYKYLYVAIYANNSC